MKKRPGLAHDKNGEKMKTITQNSQRSGKNRFSVTRKILPNVYKSCIEMTLLEK